MRSRKRAVLEDVVLSLAPALLFRQIHLYDDSLATVLGRWAVAPGAGVAIVVAAGKYAADRGLFPPTWLRDGDRLAGTIAVVGAIALLVFQAWPRAGTSAVLIAVFGQAVGTVAYRLVFGVLWPVPVPEQSPQP